MAGMNKTIAWSFIWFNTVFQSLAVPLYLNDSAGEITAPCSHAAVMKTLCGSSVSKDNLTDSPRPH